MTLILLIIISPPAIPRMEHQVRKSFYPAIYLSLHPSNPYSPLSFVPYSSCRRPLTAPLASLTRYSVATLCAASASSASPLPLSPGCSCCSPTPSPAHGASGSPPDCSGRACWPTHPKISPWSECLPTSPLFCPFPAPATHTCCMLLLPALHTCTETRSVPPAFADVARGDLESPHSLAPIASFPSPNRQSDPHSLQGVCDPNNCARPVVTTYSFCPSGNPALLAIRIWGFWLLET